MSLSRIWLSSEISDLKAAAIHSILQHISFTSNQTINLCHFSWKRLADKLDVPVDVKADDIDEVAAKVSKTLADGNVQVLAKGTYPSEATAWNFNAKVWSDGGISVSAHSPSYPGGFFGWSGYHCHVKVGEKFYKLPHVSVTEGKVVVDPNKVKEGKTTCKGDVTIKTENGIEVYIQSSWAINKVFFKREELLELLKKETDTPDLR